MALRTPDNRACTIRLFGPQTVAATDFRLTALNSDLGNFSGPPGVAPDDHSPEPTDPRYCPANEAQPSGPATLVCGYVRASVRAFENQPLAPLPQPLPSKLPTTLTSCALVKLRVSATQWQAPVWIDSDRRIEIPSPHVCVDVTGPHDWLVDPPDDRVFGGAQGLIAGDLVWDVWLAVKICRAFCCSDFAPLLTEQLTADVEIPTTVIRPRAARSLSITSSDVNPFDVGLFQGDPGLGVQVGTLRHAIAGAFEFASLPAFTHLQIPGIAVPPRITLAWGVLP